MRDNLFNTLLADISEQQKSLRCLMENLPAGVILLDADFRILGGNRAYFKYFCDNQSLPIGELLQAALPLAEESGLMNLLREARNTGRPLRVRDFRYDGFAKGAAYYTGSIIHLQIPSEDGPINALALLALDVTREVSARERLAELAALAERRAAEIAVERTRLKTVLEAVPVPLFVYDADWNVAMYNSAAQHMCENVGLEQWLSGLGGAQASLLKAVESDGHQINPENYPVARSLKGEVCTDEVVHWQTSGAGIRSFLMNSAPLQDAGGRITGAVVAATDITEQERARERIQEIYRREHYISDKLQMSFVPNELPYICGFEIAQHYRPALDEELVGGDFYDVFPLREGLFGVVMADVSGKGLKAAVYTAMTKYMLRAYALRHCDPGSVLGRLNEALSACTPPEVFVTLVYAVVNDRERTLLYANAGHEQPICYCRDAGFATALDVTGPALGLLGGAKYLEHKVDLSEGDIVLLYTDGVTDAGSGSDRLGHEAVLDIVEKEAGKPAQEICDCILGHAARFADGKLGDDAAMLLIKAVE
ncbi:MAG: SpoIIE family protein phosphatase [Armatimonadota bacterium]|nr:SpoIIE family protein phosphatase [bacterium]